MMSRVWRPYPSNSMRSAAAGVSVIAAATIRSGMMGSNGRSGLSGTLHHHQLRFNTTTAETSSASVRVAPASSSAVATTTGSGGGAGAAHTYIKDVSAGTFEQEVIMSDLAVAVLFTADTPTCNSFANQLKTLAVKVNSDTRSNWLKLCLVDGDRNANMAAAFSVSRKNLPVTLFIHNGVIVDRLNGFQAEDKSLKVLLRFKKFYQEKADIAPLGGQDLEHLWSGKGPDAVSKVEEDLKAANSVVSEEAIDVLLSRVMDSLIGIGAPSIPSQETVDSVNKYDTEEKKRRPLPDATESVNPELAAVRAMEKVQGQISTLSEVSQKLQRSLKTTLGVETKLLSEEELQVSYYSSKEYVQAAVVAAVECIFFAKRNLANKNRMEKQLSRKVLQLKQNYPRALGNKEVRQLVGITELLQVQCACYFAATTTIGDAAGSQRTEARLPTNSVEDMEIHENFQRWVTDLDLPVLGESAKKSALGGKTGTTTTLTARKKSGGGAFLSHTQFEEMLGCIRSLYLDAQRERRCINDGGAPTRQQQVEEEEAAVAKRKKSASRFFADDEPSNSDIKIKNRLRSRGGSVEGTSSPATDLGVGGITSTQPKSNSAKGSGGGATPAGIGRDQTTGQMSAAKRFELMKRFYLASLGCYPESAEERNYRARLANLLH